MQNKICMPRRKHFSIIIKGVETKRYAFIGDIQNIKRLKAQTKPLSRAQKRGCLAVSVF